MKKRTCVIGWTKQYSRLMKRASYYLNMADYYDKNAQFAVRKGLSDKDMVNKILAYRDAAHNIIERVAELHQKRLAHIRNRTC